MSCLRLFCLVSSTVPDYLNLFPAGEHLKVKTPSFEYLYFMCVRDVIYDCCCFWNKFKKINCEHVSLEVVKATATVI